jgi:RNA polymerase sigma factor (TIGR02999 family)
MDRSHQSAKAQQVGPPGKTDDQGATGESGRAAGEVSGLLLAWGHGDLGARDNLVPLVYGELRRRAAVYLRHERVDHTLQPTALVHEAYVRLIGQDRVAWQNRAHFFGVAAQLMRRILVDHARARRAAKRPWAECRIALEEQHAVTTPFDVDVMLLDQALVELAAVDSRQAQIVELRYFAGLSEREIAEVVAVSRSTVTREWRFARAWLHRRMGVGTPSAQP